ncbi:hypothetical protein K7X08_020840 [Anisodus acutangulus]|uniref:Protein kinase domain-containing protein n=1 Tax=Anisodus acutangulus TaxID=402998 RepID=A0A9Q1MTL6_9SOLA|nr:hypothetical protein K7X08_020840 [Anisodus acutangulus]
MEYIGGTPILKLGDEMGKRGISPDGKVAAIARQNILKSLFLAYGQMILRSGFFHADPHPGNILICRGAEVALLDYGQVRIFQKISGSDMLILFLLLLMVILQGPQKALIFEDLTLN